MDIVIYMHKFVISDKIRIATFNPQEGIMSRERVNRRQKDISRLLRDKKQFVPDKARKNKKRKSGS